jgi:hypothetical protein
MIFDKGFLCVFALEMEAETAKLGLKQISLAISAWEHSFT